MSKVPQLKLALWQELIYFAFIAVIPIVIAGCEIFSSHSGAFKITFSSIGSLLIVIVVLKKFLFNDKIKKLKDECSRLEHDYTISVGDKNVEEKQWSKYSGIIYLYSVITVTLSLVLSVLFISALAEQLIAFKGAAILILSSVLVGLIFKTVLFVLMGAKKL